MTCSMNGKAPVRTSEAEFDGVLEQRLSIVLGAGVPEDVARVQAEAGTWEYPDRLKGGGI